jgi:hypothetical protein
MTEQDDALTWEGDEPEPVAVAVAAPDERPSLPGILLITYGVMAGVFLIYTLGWIITVTRSGTSSSLLLLEAMAQLGELLAIASPALWFAAAFALTRGRRPIVRLLALLPGLLVVLPWPFVLGV